MSFRIIEHTLRCQHTRDRPAGAERGRENDLKLHVKQYIPHDISDPSPGDVTIIGAQANAFPKEVYEPFWEDLYAALRSRGRGVRGIWIADVVTQGQSGVINETLLGPDASWYDHGRDLLFLINQFQDEMPKPIFGVGHSMGASHLVHLALLHPRLLDGVVLIEAIIQNDLAPHRTFARLSTTRRDLWPSRQDAAEKFRASKYYRSWDPRMLEKFIEYGLRDLPTEQYPFLPARCKPDDPPPVTLTTTVAQEVYLYIGAYYPDDRLLQDENFLQEIHPEDQDGEVMARPAGQQMHRRLPELKPSVLYVFGAKSDASPLEYREDKLARTGTGVGGSGGKEAGKVRGVVLECGHLAVMEMPGECARASAGFIADEVGKWEVRERKHDEVWKRLSRRERVGVNDLWKLHVGAAGIGNLTSAPKGTKL